MTAIKIDRFFDAFSALHDFIVKNIPDRIEGTILAICYLDSLSNHRRRSGGNKEKFIKFILEYADKSYYLVSIPLLIEDLKINNRVSNEIIKILKSEFNISTFEFTKLGTSHDVDIDEFTRRIKYSLPESEEKNIRKIAEKYIYAVILWDQYRNNLIHLTKSMNDEAVNMDDSFEPYYSVEIDLNQSDRKYIRFGIPPEYIYKTLKSCIDNFRRYCHDSNFNPYKNR